MMMQSGHCSVGARNVWSNSLVAESEMGRWEARLYPGDPSLILFLRCGAVSGFPSTHLGCHGVPLSCGTVAAQPLPVSQAIEIVEVGDATTSSRLGDTSWDAVTPLILDNSRIDAQMQGTSFGSDAWPRAHKFGRRSCPEIVRHRFLCLTRSTSTI